MGDASLIFEVFSEKLDSVQIDGPVADGSMNSNWLPGTWAGELDFDPSSYRQVRNGKQANTAFAHPDAASSDYSRARYNANRCV